jgi:hypothetical protein
MNKLLFSLFFIAFSQLTMATTIEAELAKPKAYEYESLDYEFSMLPLKNTEKWCFDFNAVQRCRDVVAQIVVTHDLNFLINDKYKADVKYDDLKSNKFCEQGKVRAARLNEYKSFDLRLTVFCAEGNNIINYIFKYLPDINGIGLERILYVTCSSNNLAEYIVPLLKKFNSFRNSQAPKITSNNLEIDSPLTGEHFKANLIKTGNINSLKCQGDFGLRITITMNEYVQRQIKNTSSPNKGWYNDIYTEPNSDPVNGPDLYTNTIKKYMEELAKQNKPRF